jgi:hypothetical protein
MNTIKVGLDKIGYYPKTDVGNAVGQISNRIAKKIKHINQDNIQGFVGEFTS